MRIALIPPYGIPASALTALLGVTLYLLLLFSSPTVAQTSPSAIQVRTFENSIRIAAEQHAPAEQLGRLWHSLALQYHYGFQFDKAGDAYAHAIPLLRDTTLTSEYADSLRGAGEISVIQLRLKQGLEDLGQALAVFQELGDTRSVAAVRGTIAVGLVREYKYREAEAEASSTLKLLQSLHNPDRAELEAAYLTRARALAGEGETDLALLDVGRARDVQPASPQASRINAIAVLLAEGEINIQAGREAEGRDSLEKAVEIARLRTDISPAASIALQTSILQREEVLLRKTHHNQDAKLVEEQLKQVQSAATASCNGCTVPVTSLLPQ